MQNMSSPTNLTTLQPPQLIGYACDLAANIAGAAYGPSVLQRSPYLKKLKLEWVAMLSTTEQAHQLNAKHAIHDLCLQLANQVKQCLQTQRRFLVLGGDHSSAIGTWYAALAALQGDLGLIWVDAHLDAHTPESSLSKNIHGMPLAALLGYGDPQLTRIIPEPLTLSPNKVVLIGARSFEQGELQLLNSLNVRVYFMEEICQRGLQTVMQEAVEQVLKHTEGFGISIDIDAIDPQDAPAVATPAKQGIRANDLLQALSMIAHEPCFIGAELAEFLPEKDQQQKTEQLIAHIIEVLFPTSKRKSLQ